MWATVPRSSPSAPSGAKSGSWSTRNPWPGPRWTASWPSGAGSSSRSAPCWEEINEKRFFLDGADLVPASFVRYRVLYTRGRGSYLVFTTTVGDQFVEVVGFAFDDAEADVTQLVRSLKPGVQRS